jgi:hypothetical protein
MKSFIVIRDLLETIEQEWLKTDILHLINMIIGNVKNNLFSVLLKNEFLLKSTIKQKISLFPGQKKACNIIRKLKHVDSEPMGMFLSLTQAEGKTTLSSLLHLASNKKIIYCCVIEEVYMNVAQESYFLGVPPVMVSGGAGKYRIIPSFKIHRKSFTTEDKKANIVEYMRVLEQSECKPNMFIVDLRSLEWFLDIIKENSDNYILCIDEPTIYCDVEGHEIPKLIGQKVLRNLPRNFILSSATNPKMEHMEPVIQKWMEEHGANRHNIHEVSASGTNNSISIICSETGRMQLPHNKCRTKEEFIRFIQEDFSTGRPIFRKTYTGPAVCEMLKLMKKLGIKFTEPKEFFDLFTINLVKVREYAKYLLETVAQEDEALIIEFCRETFDMGYEPLVDIDSVITSYSGKLPGLTLMAVENPKVDGYRMLRPLVEGIDLRNIARHIDKEKVKQEKRERTMERLTKEQREEFEDIEMDKSIVSYIEKSSIIQSRSHLEKWCPEDVMKFPGRFMRYEPSLTTVEKVCGLPNFEWEKQGILIGLIHTDVDKSSNYYGMVSPMILHGHVPFVVVDNDYTYGVHSAASNAIVTHEFIETHSQGTIEQYVNRVGRSDECGNGNVFMTQSGIIKLFGTYDYVEAKVLIDYFTM